MDVVSNWPTLIPSLGVFGLLFYLVIYFLRQSSADRADYQATVKAIQQRRNEEADRLRAEIRRLEDELDAMREQLHTARMARWRAEDKAAHYRRLAGIADEPPADR